MRYQAFNIRTLLLATTIAGLAPVSFAASPTNLPAEIGYVCHDILEQTRYRVANFDIRSLVSSFSDKNVEPVQICFESHLNGRTAADVKQALVCYRLANGDNPPGRVNGENSLQSGPIIPASAKMVCLHTQVEK